MKIREYINKSKGVKVLVYFILISIVISNYSMLASAFEAHIINVTARICNLSETRTIGFWKTHETLYFPFLLPIWLGGEYIDADTEGAARVNEIFEEANADFMVNMFRAQLLAMKFNIKHFGIGGYFVESEGMTLDEIVALADDMLENHTDYTREQKEHMKIVLDSLNNLHYIKYCSDAPQENYLMASIGSGIDLIDEVINPEILGCTDANAINYNPDANADDESCKYKGKDKDKPKDNPDEEPPEGEPEPELEPEPEILGCMDSTALNYNPEANTDDSSCQYDVLGCIDSIALNFNPDATSDDGSCTYPEPEPEPELEE
jgi:hypothetical protein